MNRKPRPTDEEFEQLKWQRDQSIARVMNEWADELGVDRGDVRLVHSSPSDACYCGCPDGPCQHVWDGPDYVDPGGCMVSATCSRCGALAISHDVRVGP